MIKIFAGLGKTVGIIFLGCLSILSQAQDSITLHIGDMAPPLQYARWIKGTPDSLMNQNKLYVLEFWATWCGPCKAAMPHLSELAQKYDGKASIIGVNVWEKTGDQPYESSLPAVARFVDAMGEKMAYNVIADNNAMDMANNWMIAAGQRGIPSTFLIKDKKIIWIGHPIILDSILTLVMNNKYDIAAAKTSMEEKNARSREFSAKYTRLMTPINEAIKAGNYTKAFALMDEAIKEDSSLKFNLGITRFHTLLNKISEDSALSVAKRMVKENGNMGIYMAAQIVEKDSLSKPSYAFAATELEKALKTEGGVVPVIYGYLASARAKMGDKAGAVKAQKRAIAEAKKALKEDKWTGTILDYTVTDYEKTLKKYKRMK